MKQIFKYVDDTRALNNLYNACRLEKLIEVSNRGLAIAKKLEYQKMITLSNKNGRMIAKLNEFCDRGYEEQLVVNERRWKTIIKLQEVDENGVIRLKKKIFYPFHQPVEKVVDNFALSHEDIVLNENLYIDIEYTDSHTRTFEIVYTSQCY